MNTLQRMAHVTQRLNFVRGFSLHTGIGYLLPLYLVEASLVYEIQLSWKNHQQRHKTFKPFMPPDTTVICPQISDIRNTLEIN